MKKSKQEPFNFDLYLDKKIGKKDANIDILQKAAKKVVNSLHKEHFNPSKKMGWDLDYSLIVTDIFYEAFGHHLENYLLNSLAEKNCYSLTMNDKGTVLIRRNKKNVKRKR